MDRSTLDDVLRFVNVFESERYLNIVDKHLLSHSSFLYHEYFFPIREVIIKYAHVLAYYYKCKNSDKSSSPVSSSSVQPSITSSLLTLSTLPNDIWSCIAPHLRVMDWYHLSQTSRDLNTKLTNCEFLKDVQFDVGFNVCTQNILFIHDKCVACKNILKASDYLDVIFAIDLGKNEAYIFTEHHPENDKNKHIKCTYHIKENYIQTISIEWHYGIIRAHSMTIHLVASNCDCFRWEFASYVQSEMMMCCSRKTIKCDTGDEAHCFMSFSKGVSREYFHLFSSLTEIWEVKRLPKPTTLSSDPLSETTVVVVDDHPFATGISIQLRTQSNWIDIPHDQVCDCELAFKFPWFLPWYNSNDLSLFLPDTYRDLYFKIEFRVVVVKRENNIYEFVMEWNKIIT